MDSNLPPENVPPQFNPAPPEPPAFNRPPPVISAPAPRRSSRGTGWKVFAVIVLVLLVLSVILNFKYAAGNLLTGRSITAHDSYGPRLEEVTIREGSSTNKIAVVPIEGIISGEMIDRSDYNLVTVIKEELKRAREDHEVKAVLLKVNSPGGEVLASDEIANAIRDFEDRSGKPVIVSMGSLAASGGYYVSAPCTYIVANELTITGSIGVIMSGLNYRGLLDKIGVQPEVFKSGRFKDMLSSTKRPDEITQDEKDMVQNLINETYGKFTNVVAAGRSAAYKSNNHEGRQLDANWLSYADGRILSGTEALKLGFVDKLGDFDVAVDSAESLAHIGKAELVEYQPLFDISNLFRLFGESNAKQVKVELGVDLPKIHAGYMYFLSPTYLQ
jgi:protease-4